MKYVVTINNKNYEVEVEKGQASIVSTKEVAAPAVVAAPVAPAPQAAPVSAAQASPAAVNVGSGQAVKAPMPGTILAIKISAGTKVKSGDVLFVLEAMKMENEIVAPADGTVVQIVAVKGSTVNTGDLLAVIQ